MLGLNSNTRTVQFWPPIYLFKNSIQVNFPLKENMPRTQYLLTYVQYNSESAAALSQNFVLNCQFIIDKKDSSAEIKFKYIQKRTRNFERPFLTLK